LRCIHCDQAFPIIEGVPLLFPSASLPDHIRQDEERRRKGNDLRPSPTGGAYHWQEYGIADLLRPLTEAREILLFGCGDAGERQYLNELGYESIASDLVRSAGTDFLADGHCLPVHDAAFDVVLTMQVLEHLHSPWLAIQEIARVMRPGSWLVGSVAFLKPYHDSYFHMTYRGVMRLLASSGLKVDKISGAQSLTYTLYGSLVPLGTRQISRFVYGAADRLLGTLRAKAWSISRGLDPNQPTDRFDEELALSFRDFEKLRFAPAVVFRARKLVED